MTSEEIAKLADELDAMQASLNDGRGVSCVRTIVKYLEFGQVEYAKQVARTESDKLWQYPEIRRYINDNLEPIGYWDDERKEVVH